MMNIPLEMGISFSETAGKFVETCFNVFRSVNEAGVKQSEQFLQQLFGRQSEPACQMLRGSQAACADFSAVFEKNLKDCVDPFSDDKQAFLEFCKLFTEGIEEQQDWSFEYDDSNIILDLPGMRLIDISLDVKHELQNYTVVFAPRAGHHSNIAERAALYLRDQGLTRLAIVEQKCAEDIPLYVNGQRHYENFNGQVGQYREILECLKARTGYAPHLVAICQPGPLLMATLIIHPELGRTFGSAGSPMHTEAEKGQLTDFARTMGEKYIDQIIDFWGGIVSAGKAGAGRKYYSGRMQVGGFYLLGVKQHMQNFKQLFLDLKSRSKAAIARQKSFYDWYNSVHHFPKGFIADTYKEIFVRNALIRGTLKVGGRRVSIKDYPSSVPIWALGGAGDDIAPAGQATAHMDLIKASETKKLKLICGGGHMKLFRGEKILKKYYSQIARFILKNSD